MKKLILIFILIYQFEMYGFTPQVIRKCQTNLISYEFIYLRTGFRQVSFTSVKSNKIITTSVDPNTGATNWFIETLFNSSLYPVEERTMNNKNETCVINRITYDRQGFPSVVDYQDIKPWFPTNFLSPFQVGKGSICFTNVYSNNQIVSSHAFLGKGYSNLVLKIEYSKGALQQATHFSKLGDMTEYFDSNGYPDRVKHVVGTNSVGVMFKNEYDPYRQMISSVQYYVENGVTNETARNKFYYNK